MMRPPRFEELAARLVPARAHWQNRGDPASERPPRGVVFEPAGPRQESVWSYPRPPRVDAVTRRARVVFAGVTIADSTRALRVVETAGAPVVYFPPEDVEPGILRETGRFSLCEWKGAASTLDVVAGGRTASGGAWSYREPFTDLGCGYERIADFIGFLPSKMDACFLDDERAEPQPGGFYGGWVTRDVVGPIKGGPGSEGW